MCTKKRAGFSLALSTLAFFYEPFFLRGQGKLKFNVLKLSSHLHESQQSQKSFNCFSEPKYLRPICLFIKILC